MKFQVFFLLILFARAALGGIVSNLPGYNETVLPFTLETGYVGVESELGIGNRHLFYYFVESENDPLTDPILFWVSGGPGYSSLYAFIYEIGPLSFDLTYSFDGSIPKLLDNPYRWNKFMNLLFVDGPAGTGFSYAETAEAYNTSNQDFGDTLNKFIHKWVESHERFKNNAIYISGDGYSGNPLPIALYYILQDNEAEVEPIVNMGGYILVSSGTDFDLDFNMRYIYAYRMGLIADEVFQDADEKCNGNFLTNTSAECTDAVSYMKELVANINPVMITEPRCEDIPSQINSRRRSLQEGHFTSLLKLKESSDDDRNCRQYGHQISGIWANFDVVQNALQVTHKVVWELKNATVDNTTYSKDLDNVTEYHQNLTQYPIRGLVISGDHDMEIPGIGTQQWIRNLGLNLTDKWRAWTVDKETAGYTKKYENGDFSLTYSSVKGGGHFTQEYKPKECFLMAKNWTNGLPL